MKDIVITKLPPSRWELYRDIRLEAVKKDSKAFGTSYEEDLQNSRSVWEDRIGNVLFALDGEKPVGLIGHVPQPRIKQKHIVHIVGFYVNGGYRGLGIGEKLFSRKLEDIRQMPGIKKISLSVVSDQKPAINLYKKYGFQIVGEHKRELLVDGKFFDMLDMELLL